MAASALVVIVAIQAAAAAGSRLTPGAISTPAPVLQLAADGTTVAAVVGRTNTACATQFVIWDVRHKNSTAVPGNRAAGQPPLCLASGEADVAVGGGMVAALRFPAQSDHVAEDVLSVTPTTRSGRWTNVTGAYDYIYGAGEGDYLSVFGDGPLLAFAKWTECFVYDVGESCPGVATGGGWWMSNGRLVQLLRPGSSEAGPCPKTSGEDNGMGVPWDVPPARACRSIGSPPPSSLRVVALDHGRFLALPPKGNVSIISAKTGRVTELPIRTSTLRQADLDGTHLLILRKDATDDVVLDVRDASSGALRNSWPLSHAGIKPTAVQLEDAHAGIAVYRAGTTIHLIRVTDGKTHTIAVPANRRPVAARLEDPGLVYSFSTPGRVPGGRIEFVPLAHLLAQLR